MKMDTNVMVSEIFLYIKYSLQCRTNTLEIEINECQERSDLCEQTCINTNGSYDCQCNGGYTLNSDGLSCSGKQQLSMHVLLQ